MIRVDRDAFMQSTALALAASGMDEEKSAVTARILVEGDMIGHETHGVALLPWYLNALADGLLRGTGDYEIVTDRGATFVWDGQCLPGAWLVQKALDQCCERVAVHGVVTAAIRNSHHTCALSAYLREVTERGLIARISCSNPAARRMAPFGGTVPLLTPNPVAYGFPTHGDPIMVDVSCSITTTTMTQNLSKLGERYPAEWAQTAEGEPTDDPREVTERGGSLLALGGQLKGYKGFGLALSEDILGQGLSGKGRKTTPEGPMAQSVFIQVIDPEAFAGIDAFRDEAEFLAGAVRSNPPAKGREAEVRAPGDAAARKRREALENGVPLAPEVFEAVNEALRGRGLRVLEAVG